MRLAIVLNGRMDDFTYTLGTEASCKTPKNLSASSVTDESATITWDEGEASTWNLRYKASDDANYTEANDLTSATYAMTGLDAATTYTVEVQTVCSAEDQSAWASVEFTTPLCSPSVQKTISYTLVDSYNDGWNGASITITDVASGSVIATLTLTSGNSPAEGTVALCPNREYSFTWTKGSYDGECSYTIKDVDGNDLYTLAQGSSPAAGAIGDNYSWSDTPVEGAKFAIDLNTYDFGVKNANGVAEQMFTITNSGNAALPVTFTDATDFYVAKTVKFTKPTSWSGEKLYIYAWDSSDNNLTASWPGDEVTVAAQNEYSQWVYTATLPKGATGVIFNDGTNQTNNISTADFKDIVGIHLDGTTPTINENVYFSVPAGGSASFYVRMVTTTAGVKSGNITLSYTAVNGTETVIPVSGTVLPEGAEVVNFNEAIPTRWTNSGWSISSQAASSGNGGVLTTQKLDFSGDTAPFFIMKVKSSSSYASGDQITIEGSADNGQTWTAFDAIVKSYNNGDFGNSSADYSTIVISIPNTVNKLKFTGKYVLVDEIIGLKYSDNDPALGIYTDAECTVAAATSVTKDFGFVTEVPDAATYYIKNDGTGTMTLSKTDVAGFTATLDKTSVAAGEKATLTIAMLVADNGGYHSGNVVVTAEGLGTFTVAVSGVVVEDGKLNLNFATDAIPTTWTATNWSKDADCITTGYSSSASLTTSTLTAVAGEQLIVVAKNNYTSSSYTVGVKYKKAGTDDDFADLIPAANVGTSYTMLTGTIEEAGDYLLQFNGGYANIQRIYGLSKPEAPEMVVYDGETVAAATHSFGKVTDEADATWTLTVKNEGLAKLEGLDATLSGDNADHYTVAIANDATEIEAGQSVDVTVTQLKGNLGTHSATLTISATGLDSKVIALSGTTVDHTALDVDFDTSSAWPAEILQHDGWNTYYSTYTNDGYAYNSSSTAASLILTPLTVANLTDKLTFQAKYYSSSSRDLTVRYTTDGGITWSDYECSEEEPKTSFKSQIGYSFSNLEVTNIPVGTVAFDFYGKSIYLDNIAGDMKVTSAPLVSFATTEDNISGANLSADGVATYTLNNYGNADYVGTVAATNVTVGVTGEDVTFEEGTLTIPAGKTATITATMAFASPYGEKNGSLAITSDSWVGNINKAYTATLVDPTDFVVDFADNQKPAGWYSEGWSYTGGVASVNSGVEKPMITELIGAEADKNTLTFDAWTTGEKQVLNVYTSTDRKTWSAANSFNLTTKDELNGNNFTLNLSNGDQYIKFGGVIATVDNIKGVKKLEAPEHDLYEISTTMANTGTPGAEYTATVTAISLRADETVTAELWVKKGETSTPVASLENQSMTVNTSKTFTLTGNLPTEEGEYTAWVTVKNSDNSCYFNTDVIDFTLEHTTSLAVNSLSAVNSSVQADDNNMFTADFTVTLQNTGSKTLAASEVSVSITDDHNAEANVYTTKTAAQYVYLYPTDNYTASSAIIAVWNWSNTEDGEWVATTDMGSGLYIAELKEGKTNFSVVRINPDGTDEDAWNNKWNQSVDLSTTNGNVFAFQNWGEGEGAKDNFSASAFTLASGATLTLPVSVTGTLTDGESASLTFNAKENVTNTFYHNNFNVTVNITAAPVIELDETVGTVASQGQNRKVSLKHSFVAGWNTICVPFALEATDIHTGAKALEFSDYNESTRELTFSPVTTELEANKPYVIYVPEAINSAIEFSGKTVATSDNPETAFNGVTFQGTYAPVTFSKIVGDQYGLTAAGRIAKASDTATMKGFRAYFDGNLAGARTIFMDESTGIKAIDNSQLTNDNCYNLQGQKVENLKKGNLYIINGKKTVVK